MTTYAVDWKPSELIRNLKTGRLYMVLQVIKGYAMIIAPMDQTELPPTQTLFTRDYIQFARDCEVEERNGIYKHAKMTL